MNYQRRRRLYSQNFLRDPKLVKKLVRNSSICKNDLVVEIGFGKGIITKELVDVAGKVLVVELDHKLTLYLKERLWFARNLEIINSDFLQFNLPKYPYKVFANIPFNISSEIVRKLTDDINFSEGYLVVQKEFAKKIIGKPYDDKNSMMSALLKPWFDMSIFHKFERQDFVPFPHVDSVMVKIQKREIPLLPYFQKDPYRDFILVAYNREKNAKEGFENILNKFYSFMKNSSDKEKEDLKKEADKIFEASKNIQKIRRTRKDRRWRKF